MSDKIDEMRAANDTFKALTPAIDTKGPSRLVWLAIALFCAAGMGYAIYAEKVLGLMPCNLCMLQRGSMSALGIVSFIAFLHGSKTKIFQYFYIALANLSALSGLILAGRHVWLQHLPADKVPACGPPFDYLVSNFAFLEVVQEIFSGSGDCAEIKWQFLGFSMPECLLAVFFALFVGVQIQLIKTIKGN